MNYHGHVFAPSLHTSLNRVSFDPDLSTANKISSRQLFYLLNQPENEHKISALAYHFICDNLKTARHCYSSAMSCQYDAKALLHLTAPPIAPLSSQFSNIENQQECLRQSVAIQFTQPCWLHNIAQISASQSPIAVQLMSLYLNSNGQGEINVAESYRSLLLMTGIKHPVLYTQDFSDQTDIFDEVFHFAAIQLALKRFPRLLFAEILGFTLAFCQMPTWLEVCFPDHQLPPVFFKLRQQQLRYQCSTIEKAITDHLALFSQASNAKQSTELWRRIQHGFFLFYQQMQQCRDRFNQHLQCQPTIQQRVAQLFQQKSVAAMGHHSHIQIDGISLDQWFSGLPENSQAFLSVLRHSNYVDKHRPEQSLLLKLFADEGAMSGVLNNSERALLLVWLQSDEITAGVLHAVGDLSVTDNVRVDASVAGTDNYENLNNRRLYYYLVNADLFPEVLSSARNRVEKLLRFCDFFCHVPFKTYSHEQFDAYIADIYHQEMAAYRPLKGPPKISKEAYLWGLEQIAPLILLDGCWLQHSLAVENTNPAIAEILFSIYRDEIGNGVPEKNHAYIFQQLLDSLSISVPPVASQQFISHPGFIDSAFDLPVFMLALSHFPVRFLPELLGLNMAIELSGLGKSYMQLVDDWNYWEIDPTIASIHISIDNYASGHTFLAKKAVKLYLDQIQQNTADNEEVDKHWQRICCGYASLRYVGTRFKLALPMRYLGAKYHAQYKKDSGN